MNKPAVGVSALLVGGALAAVILAAPHSSAPSLTSSSAPTSAVVAHSTTTSATRSAAGTLSPGPPGTSPGTTGAAQAARTAAQVSTPPTTAKPSQIGSPTTSVTATTTTTLATTTTPSSPTPTTARPLVITDAQPTTVLKGTSGAGCNDNPSGTVFATVTGGTQPYTLGPVTLNPQPPFNGSASFHTWIVSGNLVEIYGGTVFGGIGRPNEVITVSFTVNGVAGTATWILVSECTGFPTTTSTT